MTRTCEKTNSDILPVDFCNKISGRFKFMEILQKFKKMIEKFFDILVNSAKSL